MCQIRITVRENLPNFTNQLVTVQKALSQKMGIIKKQLEMEQKTERRTVTGEMTTEICFA